MLLQTVPVVRVFSVLLCILNIGMDMVANGATGVAAAAPKCRRLCGAEEVPFPFGLDSDDSSCYYHDANSFALTCNTSFNPPKLLRGDFNVTGISVADAKLRLWLDISYDCYNASGANYYNNWNFYMQEVTNSLSYTDNIYVAIGCDTQAYMNSLTTKEYIGDFSSFKYRGGCTAFCQSLDDIRDGDCAGSGCCQISIPKNLRGFDTEIESNNNHSDVLNFNPCSYSFFVEKDNYRFQVSDIKNMSITRQFPVVFDWFIGKDACEIAKKNQTIYACISFRSHCINSINGPGYICQCSSGYQGNPYVTDGCQDIDECLNPQSCHMGAVCINTPGNYSCRCPKDTTGDPYISGCVKLPRKQTTMLGISLGISCFLGLLLLLFGMAFMRKRLIQKRLQYQRHKYSKNNEDFLLQQLLLCDQNESDIHRIRTFAFQDLEKATNNFDSSRFVGDGGHGIVYKGLLDLQVVAIKKSKQDIVIEKEEFINEVILLSQINHRNVVKLIGCCLESEVPLLVYEFVSNGTLFSHLHDRNPNKPLSWDDRLRIATEISSALAYMHTKANVSILHRDIKSSNILLDDALTSKVSDFGASKTIKLDQTSIITNIQGTPGYLDPECMQTGYFTEKSDVYSLGIILLELITGLRPTEKLQHGGNWRSHFLLAIKNDKLLDVVDPLIREEVNINELKVVADLAVVSVDVLSEHRPTIKEVELTLEGLMIENKRYRSKEKF